MQRRRGARHDVVDERRVRVQGPRGRVQGPGAHELRQRRVAAAGVDGAGNRVVLLELLADLHRAVGVALHAAAVDARADGVRLRVVALGDRAARRRPRRRRSWTASPSLETACAPRAARATRGRCCGSATSSGTSRCPSSACGWRTRPPGASGSSRTPRCCARSGRSRPRRPRPRPRPGASRRPSRRPRRRPRPSRRRTCSARRRRSTRSSTPTACRRTTRRANPCPRGP
mmetsp:Transcript_18384/g.54616  ORF Transcript_18384/g.54616 Transcript_18384/m.54616 type:complete len:230 (+) Transcript_18384:286-975(+)